MDLTNFVPLVTIFAVILCATGAPFVNTEVNGFEECGHGALSCTATHKGV